MSLGPHVTVFEWAILKISSAISQVRQVSDIKNGNKNTMQNKQQPWLSLFILFIISVYYKPKQLSFFKCKAFADIHESKFKFHYM